MQAMFNLDPYALVAEMTSDIWDLRKQLHKTPKWRKVKRYKLFEQIDKLEEDRDLIEHVMIES